MKKQIVLFFSIIFLYYINLNAQLYQDWKWLHQSPQGNDLRWVKMWDVNTIYAIGYKGTFVKTTDSGETWTVQHKAGRISGIPVQVADLRNAYFFDLNTGIVVGTYGSIFRTTNGGMTFDSTNNPTPTNTTVTGVTFINNLTGYAICGLTNYRLLKTTDGGMNWNAGFGSGPRFSNPFDIYAFNENKLLVLNQLGTVYITTNGGYNWDSVAIGSQVNFNKVVFTDANTGYACGDWGRCRYTTNGGYNWTNMSGVLFDRSLHFADIKYRNNAVYLTGPSNYIWRSSNLGVTWDSIQIMSSLTMLPWSNSFYSTDLSVTADTMITVGAKGSIHQTISNNKTSLSQYLKIGSLRDIWVSATGTMLAVGAPSSVSATLVTHDQILRSTNNGVNWSVVSPSPTSVADFYSIDMIDDNTGFICGSKSAVYKTTNSGLSWDSLVIPNIPAGSILSEVNFINAQTGWIFSRYLTGYDSTIYKTTNGGTNWFKQKLNTSVSSENNIYSACMVDENNGWCLNNKPRPWKTTNGGANWDSTKLGDNYLAGSLYDIKMVNAMTGYCVGSNNKVYKTTNGGATPWSSTGYSTTMVITNYTCEVWNPLECVVMGTYGTVYYTSNGGSSWVNKSLGGSLNDIYGSYLASDGKLYATALVDANIFKNSNMFSVGIKVISNSVPDKFELKQNYPNPFNQCTIINVQLPIAGFVELNVYDITGREVATLINENLKTGSYELRFNGGNLSSGIYFYRLSVDNIQYAVKKMILLK
jgi:photosystem II stability/assembly factor-like uncharacterized protein